MKSSSSWWAALVLVFIVLALVKPSVSGQGTASKPDVFAALLAEVRGLRAAMEQLASAGPRVQLAMGRLQLQEQRVNTMLRRLDDLRDRLSSEEQGIARIQQDMSGVQNEAQKVVDPNKRQAMEEEAGMLKAKLERALARLQQLRTEQAETTATVAAEQSRWREINQRLEDLERALIRR